MRIVGDHTDFNMSTKMMEENLACTVEYAARRFHNKQFRMAIDDVESFFYSLCHVLRVQFPWFDSSVLKRNIQERMEITAPFKFQTNQIRVNYFYVKFWYSCLTSSGYLFQIIIPNLFGLTISRQECIDACIADKVLKLVINEFANEIYNEYPSKVFPDYNGLYDLISGEIIKLHAKSNSTFPPMFSWLTDVQKHEAKMAIDAQLSLDIMDIDEPSTINFNTFPYPDARK